MVFVGIEFLEADGGGVALIHEKWLTPRKKEVWWPPVKQQDHFSKALKKGESPAADWKIYSVSRTFFEEDDFTKALKKIKLAENFSDIQSEIDELPSKRPIKRRALFTDTSSDEDTPSQSKGRKVLGLNQLLDKKNKDCAAALSNSQESQEVFIVEKKSTNHEPSHNIVRDRQEGQQNNEVSIIDTSNVGFARRQHLLDELAVKLSSKKGKFYPYPGDVTKEEDILKAFQWTKSTIGPVSIVINNAGLLGLAKLSECDTKLWQQLLDINVLAPCIATREAIKHMKENKIDGHVININSTAGHKVIGNPSLNLYSSTKYALTALTETLRLELALEGSKIRVTSISPGGVRTEMVNTALGKLKLAADSTLLFNLLEPVDVANAVLYVLSTPSTVNITELTIQAVGEKL